MGGRYERTISKQKRETEPSTKYTKDIDIFNVHRIFINCTQQRVLVSSPSGVNTHEAREFVCKCVRRDEDDIRCKRSPRTTINVWSSFRTDCVLGSQLSAFGNTHARTKHNIYFGIRFHKTFSAYEVRSFVSVTSRAVPTLPSYFIRHHTTEHTIVANNWRINEKQNRERRKGEGEGCVNVFVLKSAYVSNLG